MYETAERVYRPVQQMRTRIDSSTTILNFSYLARYTKFSTGTLTGYRYSHTRVYTALYTAVCRYLAY
eukprot:SAG31_NODE_689_length_12806_cov_5.358857_7_plen_67_part_00